MAGRMHTSATLVLLGLLAPGVGLSAQQLLLPDNHHLTESPTVTAASGELGFWRPAPGRFQVIYDASHFLAAGISGPVLLTRLRFRGEDGEQNLGGQVYSSVEITLGSTTLTAATMTSSFDVNASDASSTMATPLNLGVTVAPSSGRVPNNDYIVIDLAALGGALPFDPTSAQPNLLIDVKVFTAPTLAPSLIPCQDTTGTVATIRGRALAIGSTSVPMGSFANPPVIGLDFLGGGGQAALVPARNESFGAACGGAASTFYQLWPCSEAFDLAPGGMTLVPDFAASPSFYVVLPAAPPVDLTKLNATPDSVADDALVTHALGFSFVYPGGTTNTIKPSTNGFVWLDAAMTAADGTPTVLKLLGNTSATPFRARLAPLWHDLHAGRNTLTHPNSGLHVRTDTSGGPGNAVCYVTWFEVGQANTVQVGGHSVNTFQCVLFEATRAVEFRYGSIGNITSGALSSAGTNAITGFTRGRIGATNSVDPQSRDLSIESIFATAPEGTRGHIAQSVVSTPLAGGPVYGGRMFAGQTLRWNADGVPPGAVLGVQLLDLAATRPGLQVPGLTAPGCLLSLTSGALLWEVFLSPPASVTGTVPFVVPNGFNGVRIHSQFVVIDGLFGGSNLITAASNSLVHTVGLN